MEVRPQLQEEHALVRPPSSVGASPPAAAGAAVTHTRPAPPPCRPLTPPPCRYDRQPVDCTSRVACSLVYQADMRCKAAWEEAVAGGAARPETNPDCTCSADLPRNKRWFGGAARRGRAGMAAASREPGSRPAACRRPGSPLRALCAPSSSAACRLFRARVRQGRGQHPALGQEGLWPRFRHLHRRDQGCDQHGRLLPGVQGRGERMQGRGGGGTPRPLRMPAAAGRTAAARWRPPAPRSCSI